MSGRWLCCRRSRTSGLGTASEIASWWSRTGRTSANHMTTVVSGSSSRARSSTWAQASRASCSGDATAISNPQHLSTTVENTGRFVVTPRRIEGPVRRGEGGPHVSTPSSAPTGRAGGLDTLSPVKAFVLRRCGPRILPRGRVRTAIAPPIDRTIRPTRRTVLPWPRASEPTSRTTADERDATASACACARGPDVRSCRRVAARAARASPPEVRSRDGARGARSGASAPRKAGGTVPCARLGRLGSRGHEACGRGRRAQPGQAHPAGSLATGIAAGHR